jgi:hypothetical protein
VLASLVCAKPIPDSSFPHRRFTEIEHGITHTLFAPFGEVSPVFSGQINTCLLDRRDKQLKKKYYLCGIIMQRNDDDDGYGDIKKR